MPDRICAPDWEQVRDAGRARVRVHSGGALRLDGSSNLFGGVRINVFPQAECRVGEGSYVAFNSRIFCEKSVHIGSNCAISWDVEIMDTDFHRTVMQDAGVGRSGIVIGDHAWIGAGARILKGVELGSNVVVGAGSVVTKSFEDNAIVAGNPARVIGRKEGCVRV